MTEYCTICRIALACSDYVFGDTVPICRECWEWLHKAGWRPYRNEAYTVCEEMYYNSDGDREISPLEPKGGYKGG